MRKPITATQEAARDERRARMRQLAQQVSAMTPDARAEFSARINPVTIEGRSLSAFNSCLVAFQCPDVTIVGGFRQWLAAGRQVRKGEHGLGIWIPRFEKDADAGDPAGFIFGTVFDVSQTDPIAVESAA